MPDKHIISLLFAFSVLGSVLVSQPFKDSFNNGNTDISYRVTEKKISFVASYPKANAERVHVFVQKHLHLADLHDLSRLEIREYKSPDGFLSVYIKSRDGYLKVVMKKSINTPEAEQSMKLLAAGVRKALAGN